MKWRIQPWHCGDYSDKTAWIPHFQTTHLLYWENNKILYIYFYYCDVVRTFVQQSFISTGTAASAENLLWPSNGLPSSSCGRPAEVSHTPHVSSHRENCFAEAGVRAFFTSSQWCFIIKVIVCCKLCSTFLIETERKPWSHFMSDSGHSWPNLNLILINLFCEAG